MEITASDLEKAALLHDIGKVYQRAGVKLPESKTQRHSAIGAYMLKKFMPEKENIIRAVAHHHKNELTEENPMPANDDMSYIIYEADNLAAAADRRENRAEESDDRQNFNAEWPLRNIFDQLPALNGKNDGSKSAYHLQIFEKEKEENKQQQNHFLFPESFAIRNPKSYYQKAANKLNKIFQTKSLADMSVNELLQILNSTMSFIPSSTNTREIPDISLYDHQKITAAFAVCMWQYFQEKNITNYKSCCYGSKNKTMRQKDIFLLISGDMSGIQKFIYTIPSKGALKSLRGRSLYLDVLLEHIADEILEACGVSRSCLLYTGGGHFYMLLPNTDRVKTILDSFQIKLQDWFLRHYGNRLYMAFARTECCAYNFMNWNAEEPQSGKTREIFLQVSQALKANKLQRYSENQLEKMFDPQSEYNKLADAERECAICHNSITAEKLHPYGEETDGEEACEDCNGLYFLGQDALQYPYFAVSPDKPLRYAVSLPDLQSLTSTRDLYLRAGDEKSIYALHGCRRIYKKNMLVDGIPDAVTLWMADYTATDESKTPLDFLELAKRSQGIERIGILRADVDNLGAAFIAGIDKTNDTLSRKATLSRGMAFFFKRYLKELCEGKTIDGKPGFMLFTDTPKTKRNLHVIYSGGDDVFIAGAWDDVIEAAVDLRTAFQKFTNGRLTFSAGIGLFHASYPIAQMARQTGELEDYAKENSCKDSIALFGKNTEYDEEYGMEGVDIPCFSWKEFVQGVCGEKLCFLGQNFSLKNEEDMSKLPLGKSSLYRILQLLRDADKEKDHINVARFAYVLARMEPKREKKMQMVCYQNVRNQLYNWYNNTNDRQQLITAIELLVYHKRDGEE